jgi:hypothetical protein
VTKSVTKNKRIIGHFAEKNKKTKKDGNKPMQRDNAREKNNNESGRMGKMCNARMTSMSQADHEVT